MSAPWTARRMGYLAAAWGAVACVQYVVVSSLFRDGLYLGMRLSFYGATAASWTLLTPLAGWWTRAPRSLGTRLGRWLTGIAAAAALDAAVRRAVVTMQGGDLPNPYWSTALYYVDVTTMQFAAAVLVTRLLEAHDALVARARLELSLRAQLARARLTQLEAQLQPHFLFNALGTICELAYEAPEAATRMLRQLATLLRSTLGRRGELVALREELADLEPYLEIQRLRFADWLLIEHEVDAAALDLFVPRLLLQPLVENAIKHGLVQRTARGVVTIVARLDDVRLFVTVRDNGVGLRAPVPGQGYGIGLHNTRERLAALYGDDWSLALRSRAEGGAETVLSIPARREPLDAGTETVAAGRLAAHPLLEHARRRPVRATVLGALAWATLWFGHSSAYLTLRGRAHDTSLVHLVTTHLLTAALLALTVPLVVHAARRWPIELDRDRRRTGGWRVACHLALAATLAVVQAIVWRTVVVALFGSAPPWPSSYVTSIFVNVFAYLVLLAATHYERATSWLRERESTAAALHAAIEESRFGEVTRRVRPESILDTLDALAARRPVDGPHTVRTLRALAHDLRRTLEPRAPSASHPLHRDGAYSA